MCSKISVFFSATPSVDAPELISKDDVTKTCRGPREPKSGATSKFNSKKEKFEAKLSNSMQKFQQKVKDKRTGGSKENYFKKKLDDVYDCGQVVEIGDPLCRLQEALQG